MKRTTAGRIWFSGMGVCILSALLYMTGLLPLWTAVLFIVCAFPVCVITLFFWWMAGKGGGDTPFIGY